MPSKPTFFPAPPDFRAWLETHHDKFPELLVGFYKKDSGKPSITWPESVDAALCFGWIDGVRKSIDETSYMIRFTPRRPNGTWSAINIKRLQQLKKMGLMHPAGIKAVAARSAKKSGIYAYEQRPSSLVNRRSSFAQTRQPGNSSVLKPLGTKGWQPIGSSAQKRKKQSSTAFRAHRPFTESAHSSTAYAREEEVTLSRVM